LASEQTRRANRLPKVLAGANLKRGAVASDLLGQSGRAMLRSLIRGEPDPGKLAERAEGRWRAQIPERKLALEGHFSEPHRFLGEHLLGHLDELERPVEEISSRIAEQLRPLLDGARLKRREAIPGVNRTTIENLIAESGGDRSVSPDDHHLSSWAGICPGNEESAGKRLRSRTTRKNRWLRRALVEAAGATGRTKESSLGAQSRRLAARGGQNRALLAVGPSLLVLFSPRLKSELEDQDLGVESFERWDPERLRRSLVKRRERLGYQVTLRTPEEAA
jgi:transposase